MTIRSSARAASVLMAGLAAAMLATCSQSSARAEAGLPADRPKPRPTTIEYFDYAKWQRDADKALQRNLRGESVDWYKVYRGALRRYTYPARTAGTKHRHAHSATAEGKHHRKRHHHRRTTRHPGQTSGRPRHSAPHVTVARPPKKPQHSRAPAAVSTRRTPPPSTHEAPPPTTGRRASPLQRGEPARPRSWNAWNILALVLLPASLLIAVAFGGRRHLALLLAVFRMRAHQPPARVMPTSLTELLQGATAPLGLDPFAVGGLALVGAGAAPVTRGLVMALLTDRPAGSVEVVMSRTDAWDLLGIGTGHLVDERIPGLVLTDDFPQTKAHLQRPGPHRLFITCSGGLDLLHDLLTRERGRIAGISLTPWLHETIEITADGQITTMSDPYLANAVTGSLPTLSRPQAYARLMTLPTVRKEQSTTQPR